MVGVVQTLYGVADARHPAAGPLPAAARGDPGARPGRGPRARRLAGDPRPASRSARSSRSPPTSPSSSPRPACSPASSPSASRPAPASSGSSSCSTSSRRSPTSPTPSSCPSCAARSSFDDVHFGYDERAGARRARPPRRAPGERVASSAPAAPASRPSSRCCPGFYDLDAGQVLRRRPRRARRDAALAAPPGRRRRSRRASCSPTRRAPTSPTAARTRPTRRSRPRPASPAPTTSSSSCPTATTPWSASAASRSPAASASASPSPGRSSPTRGPGPRRRHLRRRRQHRGGDPRPACARCSPAARRCSSPTGVSTLHLADRIVVLDDGRVADDGTHDELMARNRGVPRAAHRPRRRGRRARSATRSRRSTELAASTPDGVAARQPAPTPYARPTTRPDARSCRRRASLGPGDARQRVAAGARADARAARPGRRAAAGRDDARRSTSTTESPARPASFSLRGAVCASSAGRSRSGCVLVVLDALAGAARPVAGQHGHRRRRRGRRARGAVAGLARRSCVVVLVDWLDQVAETFVTGRTAERIMARRCGSGSSPTSSGCRSTTTSARWPAGS